MSLTMTRREAAIAALGLLGGCAIQGQQQSPAISSIPLAYGLTGHFIPGLQTVRGSIPSYYAIKDSNGKSWGLIKLYATEGRTEIAMPFIVRGNASAFNLYFVMKVHAVCSGSRVQLGQLISGFALNPNGQREQLFPEQARQGNNGVAAAIQQAQDLINQIRAGINQTHVARRYEGNNGLERGQTGCAVREFLFNPTNQTSAHFVSINFFDVNSTRPAQEQVGWISGPDTAVLMRRGVQGQDTLDVSVIGLTPERPVFLTVNRIPNNMHFSDLVDSFRRAAQQDEIYQGVQPGLADIGVTGYAALAANAINLLVGEARRTDQVTGAAALERFTRQLQGYGYYNLYQPRREPWPRISRIPDELIANPFAIALQEPSLFPFVPNSYQGFRGGMPPLHWQPSAPASSKSTVTGGLGKFGGQQPR